MKTNIFKITAIMLILAGSFSSCRKNTDSKYKICYENLPEEGVCGCKNPLKDLPWLKEYLESPLQLNETFIYIYKYKYGTCFRLDQPAYSNPYMDFRNCEGEKINRMGWNTSFYELLNIKQEFEIQDMENIYRKYKDGFVIDILPEKGFCNCSYPLTDLPWLENFISKYHDFDIYIDLGTYKYGTCIELRLRDENGPCLTVFKNCSGDTLGEVDSFVQNFYREFEIDYKNKQYYYRINCYP